MTDVNPRWDAWLASEGEGKPNWMYPLWIRERLTEWATLEGYVADPSLSRGVVVRTRHEANHAALASKGGHDRFTQYLKEQSWKKKKK